MRNILNKLKVGCRRLLSGENIDYILKNSFVLFLGVFISMSYVLVYSINSEIKYDRHSLSVLNKMYDGYIDKDTFCLSIKCSYIKSDNLDYVISVDDLNDYSGSDIAIHGTNIHAIDKIYYAIRYDTDLYYVDITDNIYSVIISGVFIIVVTMILMLRILARTVDDKNIKTIELLKNSEYINKYETLYGLASNVNHEVTTPLNVIKAVFEDYAYTNREFREYMKTTIGKGCGNKECIAGKCRSGCDKQLTEVYENIRERIVDNVTISEENVELGLIAVEQIYAELSTLNDYKQLETDSDSIYDLLNKAIKLINKVSVIDVLDYTIDNVFKDYIIDPKIYMSNMLFVSMVINHIKNSLEANANKIVITKMDNCIHISDNGNGVPTNIVKRIFDNDFSTKDTKDILRGNGLYINKLLLINKYKGDITLVESIPNVATTFCLKINLVRK